MDSQINSEKRARYSEATHGISKPWLLAQLRLKKLQEDRKDLAAEDYEAALKDIHADLMNLGKWWIGQEDEVFG